MEYPARGGGFLRDEGLEVMHTKRQPAHAVIGTSSMACWPLFRPLKKSIRRVLNTKAGLEASEISLESVIGVPVGGDDDDEEEEED